jgi:predicted dehydrogenase/nucleoside-diphosphate-sugar epimerase
MDKKIYPFKIGIIGCGNIAKVHARILKKYVAAEQLAICDLDQLRLDEFAKATGIASKFSSVDALIREFRPQIAHIVTPPSTHAAIAAQCLKANINVMIEKPMCITNEEAEQIRTAEAESQSRVCVDHMRSFDPMIQRAKEVMKTRRFGKIININMTYTYDYLQRIQYDPAARWIKKLPGGCFFDLLPHMLCLLNDFMPGARLASKQIKKNSEQLVTDVLCLFESAEATASLHLSLNIFPLKNVIEFECENGILVVDLRNFLLIERKKGTLPNAVERISGNMSVGWQYLWGSFNVISRFILSKLDPYAGLENLTVAFMDAIKNGKASPLGVEAAHNVLKLSLDIFDEHLNDHEDRQLLRAADVLVTGGTGFIGRRLVSALLQKGNIVRVLSHRDIPAAEVIELFGKSVEIVQGDMYSRADVLHAAQGVKTVYHLAAAMKGDWNYHLDTTITGTKNILAAVKENQIPHLVYVSTLNVYDAKNYPEDKVINEEFPYEPNPEKRGAYSHAKLIAEKMVIAFRDREGINISIVRPGLVYGPGGPQIPGDIGRSMGRFVLIFGMGGRKVPFVYVDNLADAICLIGQDSQKSTNGIFNVVDEDRVSQRHFLRTYCSLTKKRIFAVYIPMFFISFCFWCLEKLLLLAMKKRVFLNYKISCIRKSPISSTDRLKTAHGWIQRVHFEEGLEELVRSAGAPQT